MKRRIKLATLIFLVLIGFIIRIWGTAGIYVRPDDHEQIGYAKTAYGLYFQHYLSYPVFYQYVGGYILKSINFFFQFLGAVERGYKKEFSYDEVAIIMRTLSALYSAFSIYFVYLIARKIFDEMTAFLSAFFLTFTFFHILLGHSATLDPQMGFFVLISFYFIIKIYQSGKIYDYILSGLFAGFSIASKYNAIFIFLTLFLSHLLSFKDMKKPWKIFNLKIIYSGFFILIGFLIGNPPVWLSFKSWFSSFRQLPIILKPDPWMAEIKGLSLFEWLQYNKFTFALININYSIKITLFILFLVGVLYLIFRFNKEHIILLSFPFFYILLGLGIYGISRPRDHYVLIPFYIIISAKGFMVIYNFLRKRINLKFLFNTLAILLLLIFSFPSFKATFEILYVFHERDTLEFSEDWIYENIPPKTWNTYEIYTPFMYMPASVWKYGYIFPYRYHHNFYFILGRWLGEEPFEHLRNISRFVYISSSNSNRFKGVEKFYKKEVNFYNRINKEFKILKAFSLKEIEAKNPDIFIFSVKGHSPRESSVIFPEQISLNQKVRDIFFADYGDYGKSNLIKLLNPFEKIERLIVTKNKIEKFVVFVYGKEGDFIEINNKNLRISKEHYSYLELEAMEVLHPSEKNVYLIKINSRSENPILVKILFDLLKIGYEFFENNNWDKSIEYLSKKLEEDPYNLDSFLLSNVAKTRKGNKVEKLDSKRLRRIENYIEVKDIEKWKKWVERATNIDVQYLLESKTIFLESEDIAKNCIVVNDPIFINRKGSLFNSSTEIEIPFILPQDYILFVTIKAPSEKIDSRIDIVSGERTYLPFRKEPLGNNFFRIEIPFEKTEIEEKLNLKVTLNEPFLILDDIKIQPDLDKFLLKKKEKLQELVELLGLQK